jgi:hypothetical protein
VITYLFQIVWPRLAGTPCRRFVQPKNRGSGTGRHIAAVAIIKTAIGTMHAEILIRHGQDPSIRPTLVYMHAAVVSSRCSKTGVNVTWKSKLQVYGQMLVNDCF